MKVQGEGQRCRTRASHLVLLALAVLLVGGQWFAGAQGPADPLRVALAKRVDEAKEGTGAIVGLLRRRGRSFASYGRARADGPEITAETIFEIGSITKVFTALLLADMVERGEVALDDPVRKYLPNGVTVPSRSRRDITLADLATHTSGLPRDPTNLDLRSLDAVRVFECGDGTARARIGHDGRPVLRSAPDTPRARPIANAEYECRRGRRAALPTRHRT